MANARLPGRRINDTHLRRNPQIPLQRTIRQPVGTVVVPNTWYGSTLDDMDVDMDVDAPLPGNHDVELEWEIMCFPFFCYLHMCLSCLQV